jgi:hypothetical protein
VSSTRNRVRKASTNCVFTQSISTPWK